MCFIKKKFRSFRKMNKGEYRSAAPTHNANQIMSSCSVRAVSIDKDFTV